MSSLRYDEPQIVQLLGRLPAELRVAFAALCAQRLLPAFLLFSAQTGKGDSRSLTSILDQIWLDLQGKHMTVGEIQALLSECMSLIPNDDEEEWVEQQAYAEDAAVSVAYSVRARLSAEPQEAAWAAARAYEALYYYLTYKEGCHAASPDEVERVMTHPIIQAELLRQRRDLDELAEIAEAQDWQSKLAELRSRAESDATRFFGPPDA